MYKSKGFTIIELIVVVAIIAVLAAIVLVNVTGYINTAKDAAIKANLSSLMVNATQIFANNGSYNNTTYVCGSSASIWNSVNTAINAAGGTNIGCINSANNWCAYANLKSAPTSSAFCVDHTGKKNNGGYTNSSGNCSCN